MCDIYVIENIKKRMLSRRKFFDYGIKSVGIGAGISVFNKLEAKPNKSNHNIQANQITDLTHRLDENFPSYFGKQQFFRKVLASYDKSKYNLLELRYSEHLGTHLDAPLHFSKDGQSVDEIPVTNLVVPLCVVDIREKANKNSDAQLTPDDIKKWISRYGQIPKGACIAMNSGWSKYVNTKKFRNADSKGVMHFPGFHLEAVELLAEKGAIGIAVDTLSIDFGKSPDFAVHYYWLPKNRWGLECVANLDYLPASGATIIVGAPKIVGGTGGPSRIFALNKT